MKSKVGTGFQLRLSPINGQNGEGCRAKLFDSQDKVIFSVADWDLELVVDGKDVNGDGTPDIVLEGYSGGAHCCWTYHIISLGSTPGLLIQFENERGAGFVVNPETRRVEIHALDGAFDYFETAHSFSPFPEVYLRLDGKRLVDVSREHLIEYDKRIQTLKGEIPATDLRGFLQAENQEEKFGWEEVSSNVMRIVLAYLYSGRDQEAHSTLQQMWPAFDEARIWKRILETRRKGILRYTRMRHG